MFFTAVAISTFIRKIRSEILVHYLAYERKIISEKALQFDDFVARYSCFDGGFPSSAGKNGNAAHPYNSPHGDDFATSGSMTPATRSSKPSAMNLP